MEVDFYKKYCTGCGLCHSELARKLSTDYLGHVSAEIVEDETYSFYRHCPASGDVFKYMQEGMWGTILEIKGAFSSDPAIRHRASSGGFLSAAAIYLLESGKVDAVIQVRQALHVPYRTQVVVSRNREDVMKCAGSRYCTSSVLSELWDIVKTGKKYALIGRPCDILTLRNFINATGRYKNEIIYMLSFFCAGIPGENSNRALLESMGVPPEGCVSLSYRGNGWPGEVTAIKMNGSVSKKAYREAWGRYLGKDLAYMCRFCIDGTGVASDISCGDYWHLKGGKPDFSEQSGRNMVIARSEKGRALLLGLERSGYINTVDFAEGVDNIHLIQPKQFERSAYMLPRILAMKLCKKRPPDYSIPELMQLSKGAYFFKSIKVFFGTIRKIATGQL